MSPGLRVSLLGPVEVRVGSESVTIAGAKLQALLALLALSAPGVVSDDRIIDELWGDDELRNPVNALQAQIAQLRRLIGHDAIHRERFGYALRATVDAGEFEQRLDEARTAADAGDPRRAAARFQEAIALIRGRPLDSLLDHRFAVNAASRLEQLIAAAHEGHIDAELALGHHAKLLPTLLELVVEHPLWERFHGQLMIALFRCGRQGDALRSYQRARELLREELGVEPGPELRALERAVLSHDPSLEAPIALAPAVPHNAVPVRSTRFVGRDDELRALRQVVEDARLVTIVGPAGVGKSRLALELASLLVADREVWFIELAPIHDATHLAEAVASLVGAQPPTSPGSARGKGRSATERIIDRFADRPVVVVLDNCEHLLTAAARLTDRILSGCQHVRIVATSREPLRSGMEHQFGLGPMTSNDASRLFRLRAQAVRSEFDADQAHIANLCDHLDRLPLAIELAAARTKTMQVQEIDARLDDRFGVLAHDAHHDERDELRRAIDWSYDMLFDGEQRLFRHLSVFAGGITLDVAVELFGAEAPDTMSRLVDKSLLLADTSGAATRFGMLETMRAYAVDRLATAGELGGARALHHGWCVELARRAESGIRGPEQTVWLDLLDVEHDNLRAALTHAAESDPVGGLRLIGALILPWWFRGRGGEARRWVDLFLDTAVEAPADVMAKALTWSGLLADFDASTDRHTALDDELRLADARQSRAVALAVESGDEIAVAYARSQRGLSIVRGALAGMRVDMREAARLIDQALMTFERVGDHFGAGTTHTMAGVAALAEGRLDDAAAIAERARQHALHSGDRFVLGRVEWITGLVADGVGDTSAAYRRVENGLRLLDELGMRNEVTRQAALLANLADRRNETELAAQWRRFVAAHEGGLTRHDALLVAAAKNSEGLRYRRLGDFGRAKAAHMVALGAYNDAGVLSAAAFTESCLGFLALAANDSDAGEHHLAALTNANAAGDDQAVALALEGVAALISDADLARAAWLLGAGSWIRGDGTPPSVPSHRDDVAAVAQHLEMTMGAAAFHTEYEHGRHMDRADAIALAFMVTEAS